MFKECLVCKKKFDVIPSVFQRRKCCSKKCSYTYKSQTKKGKYPKSLKKYYKTHPPFSRGKEKSKSTRNKISEKVKNLWQDKIYREKVRASHRKERAKRGNYIQIYAPNHPRANKRNYICEHRAVMEKLTGRYLTKKEIVHHKDGNRYNNHPDNLQLFQGTGYHINHHRRTKIKSFAKL